MSNLDDFSGKFQSVWCGLRNQRTEYERKVKALEPYRGSAGYEREVKEAEEAYQKNVKSIQQQGEADLGAILRRMSEKVPTAKMDVNTDEQVRLLQVLSMRERLSSQDVTLAAEALRDSDTAMGNLQDLAARHGLIVPPSYKSHEEQRRAALDSLRSAMVGLTSWDGSDGDTVRKEWVRNRNPYGNGDPSKLNQHAFAAAQIAEMEGMEVKRTAYSVCRELVGDSVPWEAVTSLG